MVLFIGPEIWLTIAVWAFGVACGIAFGWWMTTIDDKRDENNK